VTPSLWAPSGPSGPPAFAGAAADKLRHCKAALEAGKTVTVDAGKKLIDKAMQPKKKVEDIMSKYTAKGSAVAI